MQTEIEVKFLNVDFGTIRTKLTSLGAVCEQPMRLMRRATIDNEFMKSGKDAFMRVRDEGDKVTMTYKQIDSDTVDGVKEIEVVVSDFEKTLAILAQAGLSPGSMQESRREAWHLGEVEIVLDEWPWLDPYIEIEGPDEQQIREVAERLKFDWRDAVFGDVMAAYRVQYPYLEKGDGRNLGNVAQVRFGDPFPELLKDV